MQYIGELTGDQIINMIDEEIKLIDYTGDITLTNTETKKILIIPLIREVAIITPKKTTDFLDLPVEIRNIIKDFTFNDYDNGKDLKKTFDKEFTNIDNMILLKKMFGEFPKEIILNRNMFNYLNKEINLPHWREIDEISIKFKNHLIKTLNNSNLIKYKLEYNNIKIYIHARLYNNLNFDFIIWFSPNLTYYKKKKIYQTFREMNMEIDYFYMDKQGNIYDKDIFHETQDKIGCVYLDKDMYDLITYIKHKLYNS
jgi:hypothetical protein